MRVEIDHRCGRVHHSYAALAACVWPDAGYVVGDGGHALVAHCDIESVTLYPSHDVALAHLADLEDHGCGMRCRGDHEVVSLVRLAVTAG